MRYTTATADEAEPTDRGKMVNNRVSRYNGSVVNMYVAAQQDSIHQYHVVVDSAVVGDMTVGHEHVSMANSRNVILLFRTPVDGDALPKNVVVSDHYLSCRFLIAHVLWFAADHASWVQFVVGTKRRFPVQHHVAGQFGKVADDHFRSNHAKWSDDHPFAELGSGGDLR